MKHEITHRRLLTKSGILLSGAALAVTARGEPVAAGAE